VSWIIKEVEMRNQVLVLMTTVAIFACGAIGAGAQAPVAPATDHEMGYGMPMAWPHHGYHGGHGMVGMRIIFSLMDADGDGTVSLQEWQAAQERIFKAMDTDHDGTVTLEEMQAFMRGRGEQ
jgi:hypothetical protein